VGHSGHGGHAGHVVRGGAHGAAGAAGAGAGGIGGILGTLLGVILGIIKWGLIGLITLVGIGVGVAVVGSVLIFTGKPSACTDRQVPVSTAASDQLRSDWDQFTHAAATGQATLTLTETGVTSRGVEYIDEKDIPLKNLQVHFCSDGLGEALGTIDTPGPDINVLLRGNLDLSGSKPRIDVRTIKAGNFPGFGTGWILDNVVKKGNADILNIDAPLKALKVTDGSAALTAGP
jgi:hypothetical protein